MVSGCTFHTYVNPTGHHNERSVSLQHDLAVWLIMLTANESMILYLVQDLTRPYALDLVGHHQAQA